MFRSLKITGLTVVLSASASWGAETICFIPGFGGGSDYNLKQVPAAVTASGIPMIAFEVGKRGTVEQKAQNLKGLLEAAWQKDPTLQCHFYGFSMGGVIERYFYHHVAAQHPTRGLLKGSQLALSMSSFGTPHRGTPISKLLGEFLPGVEPGGEELSEEKILKFNDPNDADFYSPVPQEVPFYSYRTFIKSADEAPVFIIKMGFQLVGNDLRSRGLDPSNDGVIPTASQGFGEIVSDLRVSHSYFSQVVGTGPQVDELYARHWAYIQANQSALLQQQQN